MEVLSEGETGGHANSSPDGQKCRLLPALDAGWKTGLSAIERHLSPTEWAGKKSLKGQEGIALNEWQSLASKVLI